MGGVQGSNGFFPPLRLTVADTIGTNVFENRHIVMIGDSLMRYQYISLVYFLRHKYFVHNDTTPNILLEQTWNNWQEYMRGASHLLAPNEYCDSFRGNDKFTPSIAKKIYENRYYYDIRRNIRITFFLYLGDFISFKGRWVPGDGTSNMSLLEPSPCFEYNWEYHNITDFITNHVSKLEPTLDLLMLNAGFWPNKYNDKGHVLDVITTVNAFVNRSVWKTTNCKRSHHVATNIATEQLDVLMQDMLMCSFPSITCFNISWTCVNLTQQDYWDEVHFYPPIYSHINTQFISLLDDLFAVTKKKAVTKTKSVIKKSGGRRPNLISTLFFS